jgi:hypothetical protein
VRRRRELAGARASSARSLTGAALAQPPHHALHLARASLAPLKPAVGQLAQHGRAQHAFEEEAWRAGAARRDGGRRGHANSATTRQTRIGKNGRFHRRVCREREANKITLCARFAP